MPRISVIALAAASLLVIRPAAGPSPCSPQSSDSGSVALTGVTLWDGTGAPLRPGTTILITGQRIAGVFPDGSRPLPAGTATHFLTGKYVIPGLIDSHTHIAGEPSGEDRPERETLRLCRALLGGVTAVRDMAGDGRTLASLQRDALVGDIAAPDIYYVALWAGPSFFADPRTAQASAGAVPGTMPWMRSIDSTTDLRQAVAEAKGAGVTALKLYQALSPRLIRAIVREAHRQGLRVWSHAAMSGATPRQIAEAGSEAVSHASLLVRELTAPERQVLAEAGSDTTHPLLSSLRFDTLFTVMRAHGTVLEPTLFIFQDNPVASRLAGFLTRKAHRADIALLAGTDSLGNGDPGGYTLPNLHEELRLLVEQGGLTPVEALFAATRTAARVLGAADLRGTVEAGKLADLLVLDADPTVSISNTREVHLVIKRGAWYWPAPVNPEP